MKPLHWDVIPPRELKDTLWDKLDDTKIKLNLDKFEEKFSQVKKETKKKKLQKHLQKLKKNHLLMQIEHVWLI